jgi:PLP dependent protein
VNISGDANKHGFASHELIEALPAIAELSQLKVCGLMTMAAFSGGSERARYDFSQLRELRDKCQNNCPDNISLHELSMGMSNDYHEAILEGATMIRIGSALWEGTEAI